jgi:CheY-like chemotaxis protein
VKEPSKPQTTGELPRPSAAPRVLLVDDDFGILDGVSELLESEGFFVVPASNGLEALNRLRSGLRVDAIVLDVMMPMMDGWDFRAEQLADSLLRKIPVVVISASGFSQVTLQRQLYVVEVLPKPLDPAGLVRALKAACGGSAPGGTSSPQSTHE